MICNAERRRRLTDRSMLLRKRSRLRCVWKDGGQRHHKFWIASSSIATCFASLWPVADKTSRVGGREREGDRGWGETQARTLGAYLRATPWVTRKTERYKTVVKHSATSGPVARAKTILTKRFDHRSRFVSWAFASIVLHIDVEPNAVAVLKPMMSGYPARIGRCVWRWRFSPSSFLRWKRGTKTEVTI